MTSPEPSFDAFFNSQRPTTSHQGSFDYPASYASSSTPDQQFTSQLYGEPAGMTDEPQSLPQHAAGITPNVPGRILAHSNPERKDSVPFDPSSSSTLIASATNGHQTRSPLAHNQQLAYTDLNAPGGYNQFTAAYANQQSPGFANSPQPHQQHDFAMLQNNASGNNYYGSGVTSEPQGSNAWGADYLTSQPEAMDDTDNRRGSWHGSQHLDTQYDEQINELQRIISNASSHAGTPSGSRVASPFNPDVGNRVRHDSVSSVGRSPSPAFHPSPGMAAPSPPFVNLHRGSSSSLSGSPSFSKPQSPPALIIPNSAPSPSLPQIVTQVTQAQSSGPSGSNGGGQSGGQQFGNSLLVPVNPALPTGMAGISPIASNADGPMIYIQPSTPISGLKDQSGVFDAALRRANAQQQLAQANAAAAAQQHSNGGSTAGSVHDFGGDSAANSPGFAPQPPQQQSWSQGVNFALGAPGISRPRAKSESYMQGGEQFERQAVQQIMNSGIGQFSVTQALEGSAVSTGENQWNDINAWRVNQAIEQGQIPPTLNPRELPGNSADQLAQLAQITAQRQRLQLNTDTNQVFKYEPGQFSPTSLAFYHQLGISGNNGGIDPNNFQGGGFPLGQQALQGGSMLGAPETGFTSRRRSFAEGTSHPAAGAGTPGYGVEFIQRSVAPGAIRGVQLGVNQGHRRAARSEDFGRGGTGWGVGQGGSTADFLQSINQDQGSLLAPPMRGRSMSHSRRSSASSVRSASPALSVSSQGSSFSHHSGHMDMPDGVSVHDFFQETRPRVAKLKVTSMATEVASASRRTNEGSFRCPVPGCGSTFTRHFNLKGHMRSHNDERPYKCLYDGCAKATVGFARQHDCKRHMLLHEGLRPFECEGCGKKFARLDALTRHHKSEQGQECAISHPLPTNPDGSAMSESQYKAYRVQQVQNRHGSGGGGGGGGLRSRPNSMLSADYSADERSGAEDLGHGSGMEDYDRD
ncbi:hypothetical protein Q8F55_009176 [Vanrija albida]|uniref:C2H2-type domain-containing protein n=1 Tax=Vanrija albida TaxID=181172 RepID=A0ABR3PSW2_9TREE